MKYRENPKPKLFVLYLYSITVREREKNEHKWKETIIILNDIAECWGCIYISNFIYAKMTRQTGNKLSIC